MKSRERVGIKGYGAYIPFQRLPSTEVARVWKGGGSGPNLEKAVASIDEDTVTMAIEASQYAMKMAGIEELGAIFVGTESKPYAVKPTSTIVAQALGQHKNSQQTWRSPARLQPRLCRSSQASWGLA